MSYGATTYSEDTYGGSGEFTLSVTISVTSVSATAQVGQASAGQFVTVIPTGVSANTIAGSVLVSAARTEDISGVSANVSLGPYSIATQGNVSIVIETPITATMSVGNETVNFGVTCFPSGVSGTATLGNPTIIANVIAKPRQNEDFVITVKSTGSGNKYFVNGIQQQMPTALHKGFTYKFDQSDSSNTGHPLRFSTTQDGSNYTDGVTVVGTPGQSGAYTQIVVADNAPSTLYVKCNIHSGMGFAVTVGVNVNLLMTLSEGDVSLSMGATAFPTGVSTLGQIGTVLVQEGSTVYPTSVTATGEVGELVLWQEVDTSQTPNWTRIAA
jgi:hypothetical protein|tara:strand:- start:1038 stop:2018 length:981 start_codon:yes stop_codon:yes gene_type:complete